MEKNQIIKIHGTDYKEMTKELLTAAKLEELLPEQEKCIGIKPNLVSPSTADWGATTHPEVVAGIIEYLQERGYRNIMIAEGSWVGDRTAESIEVCGYDVLAETYKVALQDAQKDTYHEKDCGGLALNICDCVEKIDFLINVPVMKGHCQTKITCALKNMKGLIPNREKRRFHSLGLHRPIAHLGVGIRQDFIVVDHICGDLDFEDGGNPVVCNCVMAGCDPVLMDAYVCHLLHYEVDEVPYIRMAEELGVGCADVSAAEIFECKRVCESRADNCLEDEGTADTLVETDEAELLVQCKQTEELPKERKIVELRDAVEEVESCSACYGYLIPALEQLRQEGLLDKLDAKICIGQGYQGQTGKIGVGRCTAKFEHHVNGCPPTETQIYEFLKDYIRTKESYKEL